MPLYDLMLLIDPNAPEERQAAILEEIRGVIESDGNLVGSHDWGSRRLAFDIDHRREAVYRLMQFVGAPPLLERLRHGLRIADGVLRFRIIRQRPGPPPTPRPESARPRQEASETTTVAARAAADAPPGGGDRPEPATAGDRGETPAGAVPEQAPETAS